MKRSVEKVMHTAETLYRAAGVTLVMLAAGGCDGQDAPRFGWVDAERLRSAGAEPGQWLSGGRDFRDQHYSPLDVVNEGNVHQLGFAWEYDARSRRGRAPRGLEATPLVVDGVLYTSGAWSVVYALDAATGEELWRYDPDVDGSYARAACCDVVNRGVQVWEGRVYVGTLDGWLVALDAATGEEVWKADTFIDRSSSYTITGAPRVAGDVVVIGNSGGEFGVRGYISAYDAKTGELAWRFFTVPGDPDDGFEHPEMEMAAETWDPNSRWEFGGGGTVWGHMAYDPELDLLFVGVGNSSPYPVWFRSPNGGDNLFLTAILAIDPDTGRLVWHYQTTPGESWDYTATQNMILAELEVGGERRDVLMQAPKNGFFYVLDRATGELLSAENYVPVNWASHVDLETGRPVVTEQADYRDGPRLIYPSMAGGHNWMPMAYSPVTGLVYIPALDMPSLFIAPTNEPFRPGELNMGVRAVVVPPIPPSYDRYLEDQPEIRDREMLLAWDPVAQREVWSVPLDHMGNGGALSTAGNLVFQGTAAGDLVAYAADTGEELHRIEVGTGIMAAPTTYTADGEQYVAVMAGYGGALASRYGPGTAAHERVNYGRILAFRLDGGPTPLPPERPALGPVPAPPAPEATDSVIAAGGALYGQLCAICHGPPARDYPSAYPDLGRMTRATHDAFATIVLEGTLRYGGMASFADVLTPADAEAVRAFIAEQQQKLYEQQDGVIGMAGTGGAARWCATADSTPVCVPARGPGPTPSPSGAAAWEPAAANR